MTKILFVCHGNICRSPMAEFFMKELVAQKGAIDEFVIASAATSTEELGSAVYPPARQVIAARGIDCSGKRARQLTRADYQNYDLLVGMDRRNLMNMHRMLGGDPLGKISLLMDYTDTPRDVADPWYTGDFEQTARDIDEGCAALWAHLQESKMR